MKCKKCNGEKFKFTQDGFEYIYKKIGIYWSYCGERYATVPEKPVKEVVCIDCGTINEIKEKGNCNDYFKYNRKTR